MQLGFGRGTENDTYLTEEREIVWSDLNDLKNSTYPNNL